MIKYDRSIEHLFLKNKNFILQKVNNKEKFLLKYSITNYFRIFLLLFIKCVQFENIKSNIKNTKYIEYNELNYIIIY